MIVYAAVDLRGGRVVQLVGGRADQERINWPDPLKVARRWIAEGFKALHVVDLDGAFGTGYNRAAIASIVADATHAVQVSGGIRDDARVSELIAAGAARVVIGTRALEDGAWRERMANQYPARIVVAADVRNGQVVKRGWTESAGVEGAAFVATLESEPLAAVLVTDVSREGTMQGVNVDSFARLVEASPHPLIAAGGIRDLADLAALRDAGVAGVVLGMSLYSGRINAPDLFREFPQ